MADTMTEKAAASNDHVESVHAKSIAEHAKTANQQEKDITVSDVFKNHPRLAWWIFYWAMAAVGWGFDAQVNGAMISVPAFRRDFGYEFEGEWVIPASWQTAFNTASTPGQLIGGFLASWIADRYGRRMSLLAGIAFCVGGIVGQVASTTRISFLLSKYVLGFGLGFYLSIAPLCTSEIAPVQLRGIATAGVNLGIAIGQLLSNSVVAGFGGRDDRWAYRGPFAIQLAFSVFLLAFLPFAPESTWYLVKTGKTDDARRSLVKLWGSSADIDLKLEAVQITVAEESAHEEVRWRDCFRGTHRVRTLISMGVFACQHLVGIIFILGYSTYFFQLAGLANSDSFNMGVGVTACGVVGNVVSWFIVNNLGRRRIFTWGMVGLTTLLLLVGVMDLIPTQGARWATAAITVIWAFVYFMTIGAMAFVILGEVSSPSLRAPTVAWATAVQAIMGLIMNFVIPYMVNPDEGNLKGKVGFIFGGLAALGTAWSFIYVPELKGRTFEEIDRLFFARVPPRKMGTFVLNDE